MEEVQKVWRCVVGVQFVIRSANEVITGLNSALQPITVQMQHHPVLFLRRLWLVLPMTGKGSYYFGVIYFVYYFWCYLFCLLLLVLLILFTTFGVIYFVLLAIVCIVTQRIQIFLNAYIKTEMIAFVCAMSNELSKGKMDYTAKLCNV